MIFVAPANPGPVFGTLGYSSSMPRRPGEIVAELSERRIVGHHHSLACRMQDARRLDDGRRHLGAGRMLLADFVLDDSGEGRAPYLLRRRVD